MDELLQYWVILKRRWLPAATVFGAVLAFTAINALQKPPIYEATGQLLFKKNTQSSLTGVGSQLGQLEASVRGNPLENEAAILRSLPIAQRVIETLKLSQEPRSILGNLLVKNIKGTDILEIAYQAPDPEKAAAIVNTILAIYIENDVNANRAETRAALNFIEKQLPETQAALDAAEENLRKFKQQYNVLNLTAESESTVQILNNLDQQVANNRADLQAATARVESAQKIFNLDPEETVISGFVGESPTTIEVLGKLQDLQQKIEVELLRFKEGSPVMSNLREEEASLKAELKQRIEQSFLGDSGRLSRIDEPSEIVQLRPQGLQQGMIGRYAEAEADRASIQTRISALQDVINAYKQRASTLPSLELQQRQFERQVAAAQSTYETLLDKLQDLRVAENQQVGNARIITPALVPKQSINPRNSSDWVRGVLLGLVLAMATAWALDSVDKSIKTTDAARNLLGYPLLGIIPAFRNGIRGQNTPIEVIVRDTPTSPVSEAFGMLQANLKFLSSDRQVKVVVVTSTAPKEGRSTIAANLAAAIAQVGRQVLLIDAEMRHPMQHQIWEISNAVGLSNVLVGESDFQQALQQVMPNLQILTSGVLPPNPVAILDSQRMANLLENCAQKYDFVVIDTAPLIGAADASILGKMADGLLMVIRPGFVDAGKVKFAKELLEQSGQNVLGLVVNGVTPDSNSSSYYAMEGYYGISHSPSRRELPANESRT